MSALPEGRAGQAVTVALLGAVVLAAWVAVGVPALSWYAESAEALQQRTALAQRMEQVAATLPELQRQAPDAAASAVPGGALLPGATDALAGAALQQRVQDLASRSGAVLASTEALPSEPSGAQRRISLRVALTATWPVFIELLRVLGDGAPQLLVDDVQLRVLSQSTPDGETPLDASFVVLGMRAS